MITDFAALKEWAKRSSPDPDKHIWTIQYDLPENGHARINIRRDDIPVEIITCFTWDESWMIRRLVRFGDNRNQTPTTWRELSNLLFVLANATEMEHKEIEDELANQVWELQHGNDDEAY